MGPIESLADAERRCLLLELVSQVVVVALLLDVQKAAHGGEKFERPPASGFERQRPLAFRLHPASGSVELGDQGQPAAYLIVSQAPGGFLEVGLEVKDRVAVLAVPAARHFEEVRNKVLTVPRHQLGDCTVVEERKKPSVTSEIPAVEKRDAEFQIVAIELAALGERVG